MSEKTDGKHLLQGNLADLGLHKQKHELPFEPLCSAPVSCVRFLFPLLTLMQTCKFLSRNTSHLDDVVTAHARFWAPSKGREETGERVGCWHQPSLLTLWLCVIYVINKVPCNTGSILLTEVPLQKGEECPISSFCLCMKTRIKTRIVFVR